MAGESYGVCLAVYPLRLYWTYGEDTPPLLASAVYDKNVKLFAAGQTPINLASVMIGNGITDGITMVLSYFDVQCTTASVPPILDRKTCVYMKSALPRCRKWMIRSCVDQSDSINCGAAYSFCSSVLSAPYRQAVPSPNLLILPLSNTLPPRYILQYLDDLNIRTLLGVDPSLTANWD
ncbi:uncharacterized protein BT62DRAFT_1014144 [Guyanagaster necrorhizus]|uniref:Uncharacterized protein n=1 Tax=Guyanagaster necrorhizus TaxID=856835 RepID=A0A9P7VF72_9AGAR|nr:uncharacterized protein BT62DRAFT_1014144 [Guyanagaster necrorhizus MCA 3950]KAG7439290.1 hypothetical protein BT62DRAFT_1014144 [Guyanagaster necrorhizus MCA 3950]